MSTTQHLLEVFFSQCITSKANRRVSEQVPDLLLFSVAYFDGCHQMSLVNHKDLSALYSKNKFGGEIILWCDKEVDTHHLHSSPVFRKAAT